MLKNQLLFTETEKLLLLGDQMDQLMFNTDGMEKLKTKLNLKTQIKIGQTQKNNVSRLQTTANVNFTKNQTLDVRVRNYQTLRGTKGDGASDEYRIRHFYNFGNLGSSKVKATSRLEYKQKSNDGAKHAEASVLFDFADYLFSNNFFKVEKFGLRPGYAHNWSGHSNGGEGREYVTFDGYNGGTNNKYFLNFESEYTLPLGFSAELNVYNGYDRYQGSFASSKGNKKDNIMVL